MGSSGGFDSAWKWKRILLMALAGGVLGRMLLLGMTFKKD